MTPTQVIDCPICGSNSCHRIRQSADIQKCDECSLVYLRTRPDVAQLEKWYQNYHTSPGSHMALPKTIEAVKASGLRRDYFMNELLSFCDPKGGTTNRILDIGCGWGAFLDNARDKGFDPIGVEICRGMADFAAQFLNIPTFTQQFESVGFDEKHFRCITAIHTLEHLPWIGQALSTIYRDLEDGGWFCGIVPNFASFCSQKQLDRWVWLDANWHYTHFTPETLKDALIGTGFDPVGIYTATDDFDRGEINQQIMRQATPTTIDELENSGMGEAIRFFARK